MREQCEDGDEDGDGVKGEEAQGSVSRNSGARPVRRTGRYRAENK